MESARIQRWSLILGAYNYTIAHKQGSTIPHADALSRLPLPEQYESMPLPHDLVHLIHQLSTSIVTAAQIRQWTDKEPILSRVRRLVSAGWTLTDLLWGSRVIVPSAGQKIVLDQLHECHPGINRMKSLARCYVWWPKIDAEIENTVHACKICQLSRPSPPKAPVHPWEYPHRPWARIHIDHAGPYLGHYFLIIVDAYSKWIEAHIVPSTSSEATIKVLRFVFSTHGVPEHLISDNGTGFTSHEFTTFITMNGIKHSRTSPYHPSSNGLAERAVQTVKQGISKLEGTIPVRLARFLLSYRITPQTSTGLSPAELLMGRRLHTRLDLIHPDSKQRVVDKQEKQKSHARTREFNVGDRLYAKDFSNRDSWIPVTVTKITGPLSYELTTSSNRTLRRHVDQLRYRYIQEEITPDEIDFGPPLLPTSAVEGSLGPGTTSGSTPNQTLCRSTRTRNPVDRYAPMVPS